jgi:hypothetical protein
LAVIELTGETIRDSPINYSGGYTDSAYGRNLPQLVFLEVKAVLNR